MKKSILWCLFIFVLGLAACEEDKLEPTKADKDRIPELLDLSKPLVKEFKEKYDINILYNFDDTLDFKFGMHDIATIVHWSSVKIDHLDSVEAVDYALLKLDEVLFRYMKDDFRRQLPRKILLADMVTSGNSIPDLYVRESDYFEEGQLLPAIGNMYTYLLGFNMESMKHFEESDPVQLKVLQNRQLYGIISNVMELRGLYSKIPLEFYSSVAHLHETNVDDAKPPLGTGTDSIYYKMSWYVGKGMALTRRSPNAVGFNVEREHRLKKDIGLVFPDRERDFRNFLCLMLCAPDSELEEYCNLYPVFKKRMRIAIETLEAWGIEILTINPKLEIFTK